MLYVLLIKKDPFFISFLRFLHTLLHILWLAREQRGTFKENEVIDMLITTSRFTRWASVHQH